MVTWEALRFPTCARGVVAAIPILRACGDLRAGTADGIRPHARGDGSRVALDLLI